MKLSDAAVRQMRASIDRPEAGPRYEVRDLLGRGGMGAVYRAFDHQLQREVALKVLTLESESPAFAARLTREARILATLEHPGIVAVHDAGTLEDGRPFYVMRLVRGELLDVVANSLGQGDALRLFLRVCDAVAFAHDRGVIHRDLKPGNIMVGEFGEVLVLDWGVATLAGSVESETARASVSSSSDTADGVVVGTPGFMAPEQAVRAIGAVDQRADIYSLGVILGRLAGQRDPSLPRPLAAIVARATAADPDHRYQTVALLARDVRGWLDGEPVAAYRESTVERAVRFYNRNRTLLLLLGAYAVVRVAILLWRGV